MGIFGGASKGLQRIQANRQQNRDRGILQQSADTNRFIADTGRFNAETNRFRAETDDNRQRATERHNRAAGVIANLGAVSKVVTNRSLPDAFRIENANQMAGMMGLSVQFQTIEEVDKAADVAKKFGEIDDQLKADKISQRQALDAQRGLVVDFKVRLGQNDAMKGKIDADTKKAQADFDRQATELANALFTESQNDGQASQENAMVTARLEALKKVDPKTAESLMREAKNKMAELQKEQQQGQDTNALPRSGTTAAMFLEGQRVDLQQKIDSGTATRADEQALKRVNAQLSRFESADRSNRFTDQALGEIGKAKGKELAGLDIEIEKIDVADATINRGFELLDSDEGVFTGPLANVKREFNKYLNEFPGLETGGGIISNTEAFSAALDRSVLSILGSGALGAGTGISDNDRLFAKRIAGGDLTQSEAGIRKILEFNRKVNNARRIVVSRKRSEIQSNIQAGTPFVDLTPAQVAEQRKRNVPQGVTADELKQRLLRN